MKITSSIFFVILSLKLLLPASAQDVHYCVDLNQTDFENYNLFNEEIQGKKIIMVGEMHAMAASSIIQVDLFIHLNKHFGVRHLLIEFGRAEAYLYNQYLQTGDEWYINHTFHGFKMHREFLLSWKKLYAYNLELRTDKKLVVHGLDFEREPGLSASIHDLLSTSKNAPQVEDFINSIKIRLDTIGIERDPKDYIYYLREKIPSLSLPDDENKKVIDEILNNNSFKSNFSERDKYMALAFFELDRTEEVYLGQFGFGHTMMNNEKYLAGLLNSNEKYHDKILSIHMYYGGPKKSHLDSLTNCSNYLYKITASTKELENYFFYKRMHWLLYLKVGERYTIEK